MDDGWGPFVVSLFLLLAMALWLFGVIGGWSVDADNWRKECVIRGVAEYVRTENGSIEWRWKE